MKWNQENHCQSSCRFCWCRRRPGARMWNCFQHQHWKTRTLAPWTPDINHYQHLLDSKLSKQCIAVSISLAFHHYGKLTCHMGSHSVTCHLAVVRIPPLPPAKAGTRFSDPGGMQGWAVCYVKADRPGIEPATCKARVQRPTAKPPCNVNLANPFPTSSGSVHLLMISYPLQHHPMMYSVQVHAVSLFTYGIWSCEC